MRGTRGDERRDRRQLGLREGTVKAYLGTAMSKLDASTRHAAVDEGASRRPAPLSAGLERSEQPTLHSPCPAASASLDHWSAIHRPRTRQTSTR